MCAGEAGEAGRCIEVVKRPPRPGASPCEQWVAVGGAIGGRWTPHGGHWDGGGGPGRGFSYLDGGDGRLVLRGGSYSSDGDAHGWMSPIP